MRIYNEGWTVLCTVDHLKRAKKILLHFTYITHRCTFVVMMFKHSKFEFEQLYELLSTFRSTFSFRATIKLSVNVRVFSVCCSRIYYRIVLTLASVRLLKKMNNLTGIVGKRFYKWAKSYQMNFSLDISRQSFSYRCSWVLHETLNTFEIIYGCQMPIFCRSKNLCCVFLWAVTTTSAKHLLEKVEKRTNFTVPLFREQKCRL